MLHQRNGSGKTPLHLALGSYHSSVPTAKLLCEVGGSELASMPVIHPTKQTGWLPLHFLIDRINKGHSPQPGFADLFPLILRWYPEAAGIEVQGKRCYNGLGDVDVKLTPYQMAVDKGLNTYYLRMILRTAPELNPAELQQLNWAERRMAMFLAFRAAASDPTPLLMARLRFNNKELVKRVVSFL